MPYITQNQRRLLAEWEDPQDVGELNYLVTLFCNNFLNKSNKKYADYNAIVGVLESAKLEFYRRLVSNYEDKKCKENGEVYSV